MKTTYSLLPYSRLVRSRSTLDKILLREDGSYCSPFFVQAAIMNSLRYTFSSSGEIFSNSLSSFQTSRRNFRTMFRSCIVFFFVFSFSYWAISSSTSPFAKSINLDLESSSIGSIIVRFQIVRRSEVASKLLWQRRRLERCDLLCNHKTLIFSHVPITCYLHLWGYHVFARKLAWYFIGVYIYLFQDNCNIL